MRSWIDALRVQLDRRLLAVLLLGFSSGLPLLLVFSTLSLWLREEGVSKTAIGLFSLASIAYALKFLWAPVVDHLPVPGLTAWLGRRRSWMIVSQLVIVFALLALGATDPGRDLWWTAFWAVILAFGSATQDIVIDAYRIEILDEEQLGLGTANYVFGYRVAMLAAGAGALYVAEFGGWFVAYAAMAALMGVGMATVLASREPDRRPSAASRAHEEKVIAFVERHAHLPEMLRQPARRFYEAVICPFADFMARPGWLLILAFILLYKYGEGLLGVMANPFYQELGFTKSEIASVSKIFGFAMTVLGGYVGGVWVARYGVMRALLYAGILQCLANFAFTAQALIGHSVPMLAVTISIENVTAGMATSAFVAYMSLLTNVAYTATQFALLTSLMSVARIVFASGGGWLADQMSWAAYFSLTVLAAVPGVLLLVWLMRRYPPPARPR